MLPKDLLRFRIEDGIIRPSFLDPASPRYRQVVGELLALCRRHMHRRQEEFKQAIDNYTMGRTDYRVIRGLARVLEEWMDWESLRPDAESIRDEVFAAAFLRRPFTRKDRAVREEILHIVAQKKGMDVAQVENSLYADLAGRRRLLRFDPPREVEVVLARYNMELARGLLYRAERLTIEIEDSYQDVFRYIKLCRLMHTITRTGSGYRIDLDGPVSLLRATRRYGIKMAVFLPALALCRKWRMEAVIVYRGERLRYTLDDKSQLISHFRRFPLFDSRLEEDFASDFIRAIARQSSGWELSRADAVLSLPGNEVMIPDFTIRKDGHELHLEIVGFWTQEYLEKKIKKLQATQSKKLIIAVSSLLALDQEKFQGLDVMWFRKKLPVSAVITRANELISSLPGNTTRVE
jgi:hypothetical protein